MIRTISIAAAALAIAAPAVAQGISQEDLNARYDRALAAGYKAMFLCSATANAERNGASRSLESVRQWELSGIQQPLDDLIGALEGRFYRDEGGVLYAVTVEWSDTMPPRIALHQDGEGCSIQPTGFEPSFLAMDEGSETATREIPAAQRTVPAVHSQFPAAFDGAYGEDARTTAVIVAHDGVIREAYADGFNGLVPQRTWSVAKSIAATLVGAAVQRGDAAVTQSAGLGEGDTDPRRAITIDHALRMASGRYTDTPGNRTDPLYFGGATVDEVAVDWPLVNPPGSTFRYANNDTLAAVQAIEHTLTAHPPSELLARLGMNHTVAETDWQGNYILSSQVWSTAPDLLRLGQLYLNDGVLPDGTRILPEGWVEYVSTPSGPQPEGRNMGYGAGWWLFNNHEGIPADTIAAQGNRGQFVVVVPSRNVVIVRRGEDPAGGSGFDIQAFTADVLAALPE
ncbi:serine hydrolase domain-containing protein [Aurantiacibacter zhengii]|uniref:Class C beta-lactamase-related serine hydrolase n=1 Tax=Aurantiacibacter zhengii TaxID=2307003 RepID=A0A418NX41_9SPHN|nr:serine hydrolase [Aurantiacibacter zhengii]RIV89184.1 class C beta-lactamase-related serine hydrolase [Aurantiacibacter zhengii]